MKLKADFFHVQQNGRSGFVALVFQGSNIIDELSADTEKDAYSIAREEYPEARTPEQEQAHQSAEYNSAEGRAWRRKNQTKN